MHITVTLPINRLAVMAGSTCPMELIKTCISKLNTKHIVVSYIYQKNNVIYLFIVIKIVLYSQHMA